MSLRWFSLIDKLLLICWILFYISFLNSLMMKNLLKTYSASYFQTLFHYGYDEKHYVSCNLINLGLWFFYLSFSGDFLFRLPLLDWHDLSFFYLFLHAPFLDWHDFLFFYTFVFLQLILEALFLVRSFSVFPRNWIHIIQQFSLVYIWAKLWIRLKHVPISL